MKRLQNGLAQMLRMLHGGYSGKHSPSTASPETGSCTVLGFDGLGKPHRHVYMLLTVILCQALALPFYNLIVVENLQTVSNSAIRANGTAGDLAAALGCSCGRKMSRDTA
jgi:hypothetical protein